MSNSLAPECNDAKELYDTCFLKWYSEKYLKGTEKNNDECAALFKDYQKCLAGALKEKGIDKLIEEAREDNKDNDARLVPDAGYITARWDLVTRLYELAIFAAEYGVVCSLTVMVEHDGLMRVFWPTDIRKSDRPGVVVGWRNSTLDVFVVAVLDDVRAQDVEFHLKLGTFFRSAPHSPVRIYDLCGHASMHVLGVSNAANAAHADTVDPSWVCATLSQSSRPPVITCSKASSIQLILYDRPKPKHMQYVSLAPIALALGDKGSLIDDGKVDEADDVIEQQERAAKETKRKLVDKLKQHTIANRVSSARDKALRKIINQVNWSWELEQTLQKSVGRLGTRPKRSLSVSEQVMESASVMRNYFLRQLWAFFYVNLFPTIRRVLVFFLMGVRMMAEMLLVLLEFRIKPGYAALKDISATAQQIEIRLQQFCYWPMQNSTLRQRKLNWASVTTSHPEYIRFYNSLWLVANDMIIGMALGSYIVEHADWVAMRIGDLLRIYTVEALETSIKWLMGWPAGLKLNSELADFLGNLFLWVIDYWSSCVGTLHSILPKVVWFIGLASFAGASMPVALCSDLLSALTIHIYSFYLASARIYHWQLTILQSLFHLFRGKKHNVLRNRIDSCDYDLDQLLVGTILFTLLFFLLPTVVVFYLNFAIARMIIISMKAGFDTLLSLLNHFPLFAVMLRVKDSKRLPGGIRFELRDTQIHKTTDSTCTNQETPTSIIYLKSIPLSFGAMFHQYFLMAHRIRKHYLAPKVLLCLLTGQFVPPINRKNLYSLQYSMLPAKRAHVWDVWRALNTELLQKKPFRLPVIPVLPNSKRIAGSGRTRSYN
ncbi:hypothetical protein E4U52_008233 [Claviceps spartinae]|nr:hypothetical protein E4U52_008233 [Claviceps spartinae]